MQASAALEIKGFQHLSVECLQNNLTHSACFCSGVITVLSSFNGIHFWTAKRTKNWTKIASLSKMDKICPTQDLFFKRTRFLYLKSIKSINQCFSFVRIMSRCRKLIKMFDSRLSTVRHFSLLLVFDQSSSSIQQSHSHLHSRTSRSLLWW